MKETRNRFIQIANDKQRQTSVVFKAYMVEFAKNTYVFAEKLTRMTKTERKQISDAFPKMQPFFSGKD